MKTLLPTYLRLGRRAMAMSLGTARPRSFARLARPSNVQNRRKLGLPTSGPSHRSPWQI
jgi:hypothetical protein